MRECWGCCYRWGATSCPVNSAAHSPNSKLSMCGGTASFSYGFLCSSNGFDWIECSRIQGKRGAALSFSCFCRRFWKSWLRSEIFLSYSVAFTASILFCDLSSSIWRAGCSVKFHYLAVFVFYLYQSFWIPFARTRLCADFALISWAYVSPSSLSSVSSGHIVLPLCMIDHHGSTRTTSDKTYQSYSKFAIYSPLVISHDLSTILKYHLSPSMIEQDSNIPLL